MRTNAEIVVPSSSYSRTETFHDVRLDSATPQMELARQTRTKSGSYCGGAVDPSLLSPNPPEDGLAVPGSDPGRVPSAEFPSSEVVHRICTSPDGLDPTGRWHVVDQESSPPAELGVWTTISGPSASTTPQSSPPIGLQTLFEHFTRPLNPLNRIRGATSSKGKEQAIGGPTPNININSGIELRSLSSAHNSPPGLHGGFTDAPVYSDPTLNPALTDADTASQDSLAAHTSPLGRVRRQNEPIQRPAATYFPGPPFARHPSASSSMRPLVDRDRFLGQTADRTPPRRPRRPSNDLFSTSRFASTPCEGAMSPHLRSATALPAAHVTGSSPFFLCFDDGSDDPDAVTALPATHPSLPTSSGGPLRHERLARLQRRQEDGDPVVERTALGALVVCSLLTPLLALYAAGLMDPLLALVVGRRGGRVGRGRAPRMPPRYRLAALVILIAEVVVLLIAITAWSVARGGR